jgi:hypothetical protein
VEHARNLGSAPGFRAGIEAACDAGAELILLLDDDNRLEPGCMAVLRAALDAASAQQPGRPVAVLGFRPENQVDIGAGLARATLHVNAFFGFHLKHVPRKLWRRLRRWSPARAAPPVVGLGEVDVAPYSGMLFHAGLIEAIGLPDPRFVLYADDTEFSYRVTRQGGRLLVVTAGRISDIEASWNVKSRHASALSAWLHGGSDLGVFYAARNRACFERHVVEHNRWMRGLNRGVFLVAMRLAAARTGSLARYRLFRAAVADGEARRLGVKRGFELA